MPDNRYEDLQIGTPQPYQTTAYTVYGVCKGCPKGHTALYGKGLTEGQAIQHLKRHFRQHVNSGHRNLQAERQDNDVVTEE